MTSNVQYWFVLLMLPLVGCPSSMPSLGSDAGSDAGVDADPPHNERFRSAAARAELICAFEMACDERTEGNAFNCLVHIVDSDVLYPQERSVVKPGEVALAECLAEASDCADYADCLGEPGCQSGCEGDVAQQCHSLRDGSMVTRSIDCMESGQICVDGFCAHPPSLCNAPDEQTCRGEQVLLCGGGQAALFDCPAFGQVCRDVSCVDGPAEACVTDPDRIGGARCEDNRPVACPGGFEITGDCSELHPDWVCVEEDLGGSTRVSCAAPTAECDESDTGCEGTDAVVCLEGTRLRVACGTAGATCVDQGNGILACVASEPE